MKLRYIILLSLFLSLTLSAFAGDKSDGMKPRWMTSSLPSPKSSGYIFISAQGSGTSLEEARQMAIINLSSRLEHERGIVVSSTVRIEKRAERNEAPVKNQEFTLEASEKGKLIEITCRVVDEYWEREKGRYFVTDLFTVNDLTQPGNGSNSDRIRLTTSYGAGPVFCSLIPGVGQFVKGSSLKGSLFLGGTAVGAAAVILCENQRADYAKKMKERPQHFDFYRDKKYKWETGRNIAIGVTGAIYLWNLIDAAVAPGRRKVVVSHRSYNYAFAPVVFDDGVGVGFAMNF